MAFNFLGTYTEKQIRGLLEFARLQLEDVDERIDHLQAGIERNGWLSYKRNSDDEIVDFIITPRESLLEKYVRSYQYYGGDVADLKIMSRGQWLYRSKGSPEDNVYGAGFQGGQIEGADYADNLQPDDANPAIITSKVKDWMSPSIRKKREEFEFRIKRTIDLVDQYLEEIILLVKRSEGAETIEDLEEKIEHFLADEDYHSAGEKRYETGLPEEVDR
jgi:hypothetical protein